MGDDGLGPGPDLAGHHASDDGRRGRPARDHRAARVVVGGIQGRGAAPLWPPSG